MPKYDYRCSAGHQYEKREGFDAPAVQVCEVCGVDARRVLTPPAIVFKGSGWYVTDSRKAAPTTSDSSTTTSTDTASDAKTETKTEAKSESKSEGSSTPAAAD